MNTSFAQQLDQHGAWRWEFARRLKVLAQWLQEHDLLDDAVQQRAQRLHEQIRGDKLTVAFVAEFSRGKSELINAIFFADYKQRIMPAGAGRTTMCPTELGWDATLPPCLRLLPIQTRLEPRTLAEWRAQARQWEQHPLDPDDTAALAATLAKVSEVSWVTVSQARELGFWRDDTPQDNPPPNAQGQVAVPRWRHALVNIAHPLLRQGLVVLDTPGLNAVGVEPELTLNLISQAHAVVFVLGVDTGVSKSDLQVWRDHLAGPRASEHTRLAVLNKIDTLWSALDSPAQVAQQIENQRAHCAQLLALEPQQVLALSARAGLLAKINGDPQALSASHLPDLERVLGERVLGQRQQVLRAAVAGGVADLTAQAKRVIALRRREYTEQLLELKSLGGKNATVIKTMRQRAEHEQDEFDDSVSRIQVVRTVHIKLLRALLAQFGPARLKTELAPLNQALTEPGLKLNAGKVFSKCFEALRNQLREAMDTSSEMHQMLDAAFRQLNAEYGFALTAPAAPRLLEYRDELDLIEQGHARHFGVGRALQLARPEFAARLARALTMRLRVLHESIMGDIDLWNKSAAAQLDSQLRERRRQLARRIEAMQRIEQATDGLNERIAELRSQLQNLSTVEQRLGESTQALLQSDTAAASPAAQPATQPAAQQTGQPPAQPKTYTTAPEATVPTA